MGQQPRMRRQTSLTLNAFSTKTTFTLGKGMLYRELILRLNGSFTYAAGANNAAATLARGDEWSLIERVDIIVNGSDTIRTFTGTQLKMMNRLLYGTTPRSSLTLGDGATAAPTFDSVCVIPFWMPLSVKPIDTALDSSVLSDLRIEVTTASSANINTANGPTAVSATLDVESYESFGLQGEFTDFRIWQIQNTAAAANTNLQVQLPVGPVYRGFLVNFANGAGQSATDLFGANGITNVQIQSGTTIFRDAPFPLIRDWQRQRLGWGRDVVQNVAASPRLTNTNAPYMNLGKSDLLVEDAWAFIDLCQDGYMSEGIDTNGFSELNLIFNIPGAGTVTVLPLALYPPRKAA